MGGHAWQGHALWGVHGRACVAGGVHGGGVHGRGVACVAGRVCMVGGHAWQGGVHGRGMHSGWCVAGGCAWQGACMPHMPPWTLRDTVGQCMGSTHPTGMHSCFSIFSKLRDFRLIR